MVSSRVSNAFFDSVASSKTRTARQVVLFGTPLNPCVAVAATDEDSGTWGPDPFEARGDRRAEPSREGESTPFEVDPFELILDGGMPPESRRAAGGGMFCLFDGTDGGDLRGRSPKIKRGE